MRLSKNSVPSAPFARKGRQSAAPRTPPAAAGNGNRRLGGSLSYKVKRTTAKWRFDKNIVRFRALRSEFNCGNLSSHNESTDSLPRGSSGRDVADGFEDRDRPCQ